MAYLEFGCVFSSKSGSFVAETVIYGVIPFVLIGLACLLSLLWAHGSQDQSMHFSPWMQAKSSALGVGTLILFLLQPTLVKRTALVMSCVKMGKNAEDVFLAEDLTIRCWYGC